MKLIEIITPEDHCDTIRGIAEHFEVRDYWRGQVNEDGRCAIRMLVKNDNRQKVMDALQGALSKSEATQIMLLPIDTVLPRVDEELQAQQKNITATREEIYDNVTKGARLDGNFLLLVALSTLVAAIGMKEDNVSVVIGAMVIAPLLGPNIALALSTALGDRVLMVEALKTTFMGLSLAIFISYLLALVWPVDLSSEELISRTAVGLDSIALALASGAAAVLSLTTGLSSVLVGVMVAVALLPPAATVGLMLGSEQWLLAQGAALLLAANIVSVNLAAKLVLLYRGIKPRTWLEKQKAKQSTVLSLVFWFLSMAVLVAIIYTKSDLLRP